MHVKIDTKEKFQVITPQAANPTVNMTEDWRNLLLSCRENNVKNIILNMQEIQSLPENAGSMLQEVQQQYYDEMCSFVICCLQTPVEEQLDEQGILELLNVTPTESEAWDIVQMEEIERELSGDD